MKLCGIYFIYFRERAYLPLTSVNITTRILSTSTTSTFKQIFNNPSNNPIPEARYTFPLFSSSAVTSFTCHIGPKTISGVIKPKDTAKAVYDAAVSCGETAGLLEQNSGDVFTTSIGNIPPRAEVVVEITTISELKHDSEVDGVRLTIPTSVAPKYGTPPPELGWSRDNFNKPDKRMTLIVEIIMPEQIRTISSPSHPIQTDMGRWGTESTEFDPTKATAKLTQTSSSLETDFVLLVSTVTPSKLSTPTAILETHPTIKNHSALMATLVPRFKLPPNSSGKPELVFIVDRSGSMRSRMEPLISALRVFLRSIPVGCFFNIISFGSHFSKLFPISQPYSATSLETAIKHVSSMRADYGGTKMLPPLQAAFKDRLTLGTGGGGLGIPINTEVFFLTDGEVWREGQVVEEVAKARKESGNRVRVFTIGVGGAVSHALVEGVARMGGGYSMVVGDEDQKGWENKLVGMLKAGLGEHFDNCSLEIVEEEDADFVETEDDEEDPTKTPISDDGKTLGEGSVSEQPKGKKKLALFDSLTTPFKLPKPDSDALASPGITSIPSVLAEPRFSNLPLLSRPAQIQAPFSIPSLFPFERVTVYTLFSSAKGKRIKAVKLKAVLSSRDEVEVEIPVMAAPKGEMVHKLAARAVLRDLEDGESWVNQKVKMEKEKEMRLGEFVEREGIEVGMKWGLASRWTSFVAVEEKEERVEAEEVVGTFRQQRAQCIRAYNSSDASVSFRRALQSASIPSTLTHSPSYSSSSQSYSPSIPPGLFGYAAPMVAAATGPSMMFESGPSPTSSPLPLQDQRRERLASGRSFGSSQRSATVSSTNYSGSGVFQNITFEAPMPEEDESPPSNSSRRKKPAPMPEEDESLSITSSKKKKSAPLQSRPSGFSPRLVGGFEVPKTDEAKVLKIVDMQKFDGSFTHLRELLLLAGRWEKREDVEKKEKELGVGKEVLCTVVAVIVLRGVFKAEKGVWELVVEKAVEWGEGEVGVKGWEELEEVVKELLGA